MMRLSCATFVAHQNVRLAYIHRRLSIFFRFDASQDAASSGDAAQELPSVCAQTLLKMYQEQGPEHLQKVVQQTLKQ
jgi:hypothetical protein